MLTLEERERLAYITNSPDHPLVVAALDADEEIREERDEYKKASEESDDQVSKLKDEVEELEEERDELSLKLGHADDTIAELREQIESSGIDLV